MASWRGATAPPSAPPLSARGDGASSSRTSSLAPSASASASAECDPELYNDLWRRAGGDSQLVGLWLAEMGFKPARPAGAAPPPKQPSEQQQQQQPDSIKAVGGGAAGAAAWGAAATAASKKDPLRAAPPGDLDSQAAEAGAPRHFFCPISLQIMRDPVMLATGQTYDRPCIERWLAQGNRSCPATGQALAPPVQLVPNVALRASIEEWAEKHAPWLLDGNRKVRPVPKEDAFGALPPAAGAQDPDLAYAIRLQQEELDRIASMRQGGAGRPRGRADSAMLAPAASFGGGVAPAGAHSQRGGGGMAQRGGGRRGGWASPTTLLLLAATVAWVALYLVSLAKAGWSLADLSLNPWGGAPQDALLAVGAQDAALVNSSQWWRLFTSPWVNAGVIQLLLNMSCLWTLGRHLEAAPLAHPAPCIATIFLLGGWVGALASANLNAYYLTCGASAGVVALLGAVWADQLVNARKYANHGWTAVVLAVVTAVFIVASLLPMLDVWCTAAALLTGFCTGVALLLIPAPGQRRRAGSCRWLAAQALCAALVIGAAAAGAVGVALNADLGSRSGFLQDGSCVGLGVWKCLPAGASPNGCYVEAHPDGSGASTLFCPSGDSVPLKNIQLPAGDTSALTAVCYQQCTGGASAAGSPSPSPGAPPSPPPSSSSGGGGKAPSTGGSGGGSAAPSTGGAGDSSRTGAGGSAPSAPSSPSSEPGGGGELFVRRRR